MLKTLDNQYLRCYNKYCYSMLKTGLTRPVFSAYMGLFTGRIDLMAKEKGGNKGQSSKIEAQALALVQPICEENGFKLWDVCFEKEGAMWYLRILLDKENGMDSDECELITAPINKIIDKQDFLQYIDILEVGSPGLTKKLRKPEHFNACIGEPVKATVRDEKGKEIPLYGTLSAYNEAAGEITLTSDDGEKTLEIAKCIKINSNL